MKMMLSQLFSTGTGAQASTTRSGRAKGTSPFSRLLTTLLGKNNKKPVAYVRNGREVSFVNIPFVDNQGTPLKIDTVSQGNGSTTVRVQRAGRLGKSNKTTIDPALRRELLLSDNKGVTQAIPHFRDKVRAHLRATEDLRIGILSGTIETPGNKDGVLKRKLKEEAKNEDFAVDAAWLEQVKSHLSRTRSTGNGSLRALAEAMTTGRKSDEGVEITQSHGKTGKANAKNESKEMPELADPRQPRVRKFQPQKIDSRTGEVIVEKQANVPRNGDLSVKTGTEQSVDIRKQGAQTIPLQAQSSSPKAHGGEVVDRITFQKDEIQPTPLSESARRDQIVKALRQGSVKDQKPAQPAPQQAMGRVPSKPTAQPNVSQPGSVSRVSSEARLQKQADPLRPFADSNPSPKQPIARSQVESDQVSAVREKPTPPVAPTINSAATDAVLSGKSGERVVSQGWRTHTPGDLQPTSRARARSGRPGVTQRADDSRISSPNDGAKRPPATASRPDNQQPTARHDVSVNSQSPQQADNPASAGLEGSNQTSKMHQSQVLTPQVSQQNQAGQGAENQKALMNLQEVLGKLEAHAKVLQSGGTTRIQVHLKPANLGSVAVQIREKEGRYEVTMRAAHPEAARAIEQQLPMIREQLAQSGIQVDKIDVQSGAERFEDAREQQAGQREGQSARGGSRAGERGTAHAEKPVPDEPETPRRLDTGTNTVEYLG